MAGWNAMPEDIKGMMRGIAAQAWGKPATRATLLNTDLAEAFTEVMQGNAFTIFQTALQADDDWAWSWHCNLAVLLLDAGVEHEEANQRAADFMKRTFEVDVRKFDQWMYK